MVESPRSPEWVQQMRQQWLADPHSVDASWRAYFEGDTVPTQLHRPQAPLPTQPTAVVSAEAALAAQARPRRPMHDATALRRRQPRVQ